MQTQGLGGVYETGILTLPSLQQQDPRSDQRGHRVGKLPSVLPEMQAGNTNRPLPIKDYSQARIKTRSDRGALRALPFLRSPNGIHLRHCDSSISYSGAIVTHSRASQAKKINYNNSPILKWFFTNTGVNRPQREHRTGEKPSSQTVRRWNGKPA